MKYPNDRADRFWEAALWAVSVFTVGMIVVAVFSLLGNKLDILTVLTTPLVAAVIAGGISWVLTGRADRP